MASGKALVQYDDFYEMLSDSVRMDAYAQAIAATVKKGDIVVDLGAGTGILGFLALRAGAARVYLIEESNAIELARSVAKKNGLDTRIVFFNANSKDVELPERADVVVSETLGCFGLDESTLDFTADARSRFLKPNGTMLPGAISIKLAPIESAKSAAKLEFWRDLHGVDFTPAYDLFSTKLMNEQLDSTGLLAPAVEYAAVDFQTNDASALEQKVYFRFDKAGCVHGVGGWFDLQLTESVSISTSPGSAPTHWKQAFFPIKEHIQVVPGDVMEFVLQLAPAAEKSDSTAISYSYRCTQIANE